jgi:hypothetical protein
MGKCGKWERKEGKEGERWGGNEGKRESGLGMMG